MSEPRCDVCGGFDPPRTPYWRDNQNRTCDPCEARIQQHVEIALAGRAAQGAAPLALGTAIHEAVELGAAGYRFHEWCEHGIRDDANCSRCPQPEGAAPRAEGLAVQDDGLPTVDELGRAFHQVASHGGPLTPCGYVDHPSGEYVKVGYNEQSDQDEYACLCKSIATAIRGNLRAAPAGRSSDPEPAPLDVERLAQALVNWYHDEGSVTTYDRENAEGVAAEYVRLAGAVPALQATPEPGSHHPQCEKPSGGFCTCELGERAALQATGEGEPAP